MRTLLISLATLLFICHVSSAQAERRIFIISNDASYGVDDCLASGSHCGSAAANAYCRSQQYAAATSFSEVDRNDITGAIPTDDSEGCRGAKCQDFVAIVCKR